MRHNPFAGRNRKIIPVLPGLIFLGVFAAAQDIDLGPLTGRRDGYMIF